MKFKLYSLFDKLDKTFGPIVMFRTIEQASVAIKTQFSAPDSVRNIASYELYELGCFDTESGSITDRMCSPVSLVFPKFAEEPLDSEAKDD